MRKKRKGERKIDREKGGDIIKKEKMERAREIKRGRVRERKKKERDRNRERERNDRVNSEK